MCVDADDAQDGCALLAGPSMVEGDGVATGRGTVEAPPAAPLLTAPTGREAGRNLSEDIPAVHGRSRAREAQSRERAVSPAPRRGRGRRPATPAAPDRR
eukprot:14420578-Alexandrium_andersonii.AAC.1